MVVLMESIQPHSRVHHVKCAEIPSYVFRADGFVARETAYNTEFFCVYVAKSLEPHNVLVPLHKTVVASRPRLHTVFIAWRHMSYYPNSLTVFLCLAQFFFEELQLLPDVIFFI